AACHLLGSIQFAVISGTGPLESFLIASAPYLVKDVISVAAAYGVAMALTFSLKKGGIQLSA
ncbi:MAG: biotin transporter BioY, partial [Ruminococcus bromii]|nr:biotin transporter BioY [Ruminococcus bromii]